MQNELAGLLGPLDSINYVQQQGQQGKLNRLTELARQSYSVAPEKQNALLGDMAEVSPQFAAAQQKQFQSQDDRRMQKLGGAARYLEQARKTGNPAWMQGAWNSVRPMLQHEIPDANYPEQWDDATMAPTLYQALALTGGVSQGKVHSTLVGSDGYIYNVLSDGRMVNTGVEASPHTQLIDKDGQPLMLVTKGNGRVGETQLPYMKGNSPAQVNQGMTPSGFGPTNQQQPMTPAQSGGLNQPSGPAQAPVIDFPGQLSHEHQQRLTTAVSALQGAGVPQEDIHAYIASQLARQEGGITLSSDQSINRANPAATSHSLDDALRQPNPTTEERAFAKQRGINQANLGNLPQELATKNQYNIANEQAKSEIRNREDVEKQKREFEKQLPQLNNLERGVDRLKAAMDKIHQHPFLATSPMTGWFLRGTDLGNEFVAARDSILNSFMALTRIAGSGAVSDKDIDTIRNQLPNLNNFSDANYKTLNQLQSTIKDYKQRMSPQGASSQDTPGQSVPVTNPKGKLTDKEILKLYGY